MGVAYRSSFYRVDFRNQLQKSKQDQQKAREERAQEEHRLKEDRLEALRQQVRVTAEADIERLIGSTEVSGVARGDLVILNYY